MFVTDRIGYAHSIVDCDRPHRLDLALRTLGTIQGTVLVDEGVGYDEVSFYMNVINRGPPNRPEPIASLRAISSRFNRWLTSTTRLAPDGSFTLRFLEVEGMRYRGGIRLGKQRRPLRFVANPDPIELDLRTR